MSDFDKTIQGARCRLEEAARCADRLFWVESPSLRIVFAKSVTEGIAGALVSDAPHGEELEWLEDVIATAISDSIDTDWTSNDGARAVMAALFDQFTPATKEDDQ